jgi:hypothetical protein
LRKAITYKIEDFDKFYKEFVNLVDLTVDHNDYQTNPWVTKSDYFGKLQFGKFIIYHQYKHFLQRRIVLKIDGELKEDTLSLFISYYYQRIFITNVLFLTLFSLFLMMKLDFFIGLVILLVNIIQAYFIIDYYIGRKKDFLKLIDNMIDKKINAA